ncbi:DNA recombination protein RmuC [Rickettsia typhi]|uniref:DNA recombination protein RmuC homolog n=2 Tax=Rickettsia typhi TaxID=785 RepID=RMUC_RICTY|nr:DNA recombination protein RmuC [Rickettsia typhi]Q68W48.1 RecName: Full=DNA recombination protein RmuC homolog [Rickettsia typhi str. Wilmington]AAU04144.1 DNA recombination protein RmuC [Rickettsia typhi str. Wilmington]AFE54522.1 DNA recombination protein RmuC [Rickettsia typhi str. TH1527]AFE55361.1 DNA recombination protein RmuC [Rickettsia typhi str. B9991CWPP]
MPGLLLLTTTMLLILFALIICFYIKTKTFKMQLQFLSEQNLEINNNNQLLNQEKITYLQKIEQLKCKLEYQERMIKDSEKIREESFASAKAALFDLGKDLSKQLIEIHKMENNTTRELAEKNIETASQKFNTELERLITMVGALNKDIEQSKGTVDLIKQSLLSPIGAGLLSEITLENILKSSGLRPNLDFIMQYSLTTSDSVKLRPDAIIFLPSGNLMVIDSKASKFLVDSQDNSVHLSKTMNYHLKTLTNKDYAENILTNLNKKTQNFNNVITLMFLPTEQAVEKVIAANPEFLQKAWGCNIFPVGPAGLMNMLSFAKFQITDNRRSENYKVIIEEVRKLLSSIGTIADYSKKIGYNLQNMVTNYDKFAASFNRNVMSRVKSIQKLGIDSGNKIIPATLERYQIVSAKSEIIEVDVENQHK